MVKLFTLVGLVRGGLVNVSSHEKQILFQKLGANNHFEREIVVSIIKIFGPNISSSFDMMMFTAVKDTRR